MVLWQGKWIIAGTTMAAAIIAVIYALSLPNIYRAEALLAPTSGEDSGGLGALAAQYGGLASLAGINLGGLSSGGDKTALGIEVLQSRKFVGEFVERHDLLVPLMASKGWDINTNELIIDSDIYDVDTETWVRDFSPPRKAKPSNQELHQRFSEILSVFQDRDTGLVHLSIDYYSPYYAKQWVDWLVSDINLEIKQQDVREAENSIQYLSGQLNATPLAELQSVFYHLIEEQTKKVMLANARPEYLFRTIDPSIVPEEQASPSRPLLLFLGGIVGMFLGSFFVLAKTLFAYLFVRDSK